MKKRIILMSTGVSLIAGVALIFSMDWLGNGYSSLTKVSLILNFTANGTHAPYYTAVEKGFYNEEGLQVEIINGSGSGTAVKVVGSGAQTFGIASGESIAMGRAKGIPVVAIAAFYQSNPACLFSLSETGISVPEDLIGKTMGVKFGSSTQPMYEAMLKERQIDRMQINEVSIGSGTEMLLLGKVDAMSGHIDNEPVQVRVRGHKVNTITYESLGMHTYGISLITSQSIAEKHPLLVERFVRATLRGWEYTIKHPSEAADIVVKYNPSLHSDIVRAQSKESLNQLLSDDARNHGLGWQTKRGWSDTISTLREIGVLEENLDTKGMYTNRFLEGAEKVNVNEIME